MKWFDRESYVGTHISKVNSNFWQNVDENGYVALPAWQVYGDLWDELEEDAVVLAKVKTEFGTQGRALGYYMSLRRNLEIRERGDYSPRYCEKWLRKISRKLLRPLWPQRLRKNADVCSLAFDCELEYTHPELKEKSQAYQKACRKAAERRLGNRPMAYEYLLCARRYYRLLQLNAPTPVVRHEGNSLFLASTFYYFAESFTLLRGEEAKKWRKEHQPEVLPRN